jgi:hypothetical protein
MTVVYKFPFPEAFIKDETGEVADASVTLRISNDPTKEKIIHFNSAGLIYVE